MNYKESLKQAMEILAQDGRVRFIGYNVKYGSRAYGTLKDVPLEKCIETPLAENLMTGLAAGMSLEGFRAVLFFERHDFLLNGLDSIVNHIDKVNQMSYGDYQMPVIIRAIVGSKRPIDAGIQHTQDFTDAVRRMVKMPVVDLRSVSEIVPNYMKALKMEGPIILVERKDLYECE